MGIQKPVIIILVLFLVSFNTDYLGLCYQGTIHPRHIIQATGISGEADFPSHISGLDGFKGDRLIHSSQFQGPQLNAQGKKAVIVGCSNSAHDIARDYYEHGYNVTLVQRSSTHVVKSETLIDVTMKGLYSEDGVTSPPLKYVFRPLVTLQIAYN